MILDDGLLPESFSSENIRKRLEITANNQPWHTKYLGRNVVKFEIQVCRLTHMNPHSKQTIGSREPLWSRFLLYYHFYFTLILMIATYHHYIVDYHKYRLDRFDHMAVSQRQSLNLTSIQRESLEAIRNHLVASYKQAQGAFKRLGAPYIHFNYVVENIFIFLIVIVDWLYVLPQVYHRLWKFFDCSIVYSIIAPHKLQESIDAMICDRVNSFIESSRCYNGLLIDQLTDPHHRDNADMSSRLRDSSAKDMVQRHSSSEQIQAIQVSRNHKFLVHQIKSLALEGMLQPFNRREDKLKKIAHLYGLLSVFELTALLIWQLLFQFVVPHSFMDLVLQTDPMDLLFQAQFYLYLATSNVAAAFYTTSVLIISVDQVQLVSDLCRLIDTCISENNHRLAGDLIDSNEMWANRNSLLCANNDIDSKGDCNDISYNHPYYRSIRWSPLRNHRLFAQSAIWRINIAPKGSQKSLSEHRPITTIDELAAVAGYSCELEQNGEKSYDLIDKSVNMTLMHTLMHYKIFVKQLEPMLNSIAVFTTVAVVTAVLCPVIMRILVAYLDNRRKRYALLFCTTILLINDVSLVMACWMHARCLDIYGHLHNLLAHVVEMGQLVRMQTGREAYDEHLVWMLRRELDYPENFIERFATRYLIGKSNLTYESLVRFHFWWGILVISISVLDISSPHATDIFGGVWRFYKDADAYLDQFFRNYQRPAH